MEKDQFHEDISFIRNMIENNRRTLVDNGITYISIGVYIFTGVIISFILTANGLENIQSYIWLALMIILVVFNLGIQSKLNKKHVKNTFASKLFAATWTACGIPIFLISLLYLIGGNISASSFFIMISSVLGVGYYLTGIINDLKFMKAAAFIWWAGSVTASMWKYIGEEYQLNLLFAALIFVLEIVPGFIIFKKWKRIYNERTV